jgi:hypothetical protein
MFLFSGSETHKFIFETLKAIKDFFLGDLKYVYSILIMVKLNEYSDLLIFNYFLYFPFTSDKSSDLANCSNRKKRKNAALIVLRTK